MDERYHNLSIRLYEILDWVGASEDVRTRITEEASIYETLRTAMANYFIPISNQIYRFGSSYEGTTTVGLSSDIDMLGSVSILPIVERINHLHQPVGLLMVTDQSTKPGYVKLQVVEMGIPVTIHQREVSVCEDVDRTGRICLKSMAQVVSDGSSFKQLLIFLPLVSKIFPSLLLSPDEALALNGQASNERNGPANSRTNVKGYQDEDNVISVRCQFVPKHASSWITRKKLFHWPSKRQINDMKQHGCFLVGVNHPHSQNGPIEWRLSFSLQERELMSSLNPTQHKCYILLKMIKKDIIDKHVPKSISSYHLKTCLFYTIENTRREFWTRGNILECTLLCVKVLLHWTTEKNCPNYFVSGENMFDRLEDRDIRKVNRVLAHTVDSWCSFLLSITCDGIREHINTVVFASEGGLLTERNPSTSRLVINTFYRLARTLSFQMVNVLRHFWKNSTVKCLKQLCSLRDHLQRTRYITEHTKEETKLACSYLVPQIHLQMAACLSSIMLTVRDRDRLSILGNSLTYLIKESRDCDLMSSYLIAASYCLQSKRLDVCERFLRACESNLKPYVLSVCVCGDGGFSKVELNKPLIELTGKESMTSFDLMRTCTTRCLVFLPSQANLAPEPLHFEMFRSFNREQGIREHVYFYWFHCIVVDTKVYLYFLQYILYSKTNNSDLKQTAIDKLCHVIRTDKNLGHKETAYNLLGWVCSQENRMQEALGFFLASWRIRPHENAAKWHVLMLFRSLLKGRSSRLVQNT